MQDFKTLRSIISIANFCLLLSLLLTLSSGCKKKRIDPSTADPVRQPEKAKPQVFRSDCQLASVLVNHGHYTTSMIYTYLQDRPTKVAYYYDKVHQLDIVISYPSAQQLRYEIYRPDLGSLPVIKGTATVEEGLITQIREQAYANSTTVYNMQYNSERQMLRIRTGEPTQGLSDFQDFEYKDGNLTKVYQSNSWQNIYATIEYDEELMQPELADGFIPFIYEVYDSRQALLLFYRQGWLGKKTKNMPIKTISHLYGRPASIESYDYKRNSTGNIVYFTKKVENIDAPNFSYTGFTSIDYRCK